MNIFKARFCTRNIYLGNDVLRRLTHFLLQEHGFESYEKHPRIPVFRFGQHNLLSGYSSLIQIQKSRE